MIKFVVALTAALTAALCGLMAVTVYAVHLFEEVEA